MSRSIESSLCIISTIVFQVHHIPPGWWLPIFRVERFTQGPRLGASQDPRHAGNGLGQGQGLGDLIDSNGEASLQSFEFASINYHHSYSC